MTVQNRKLLLPWTKTSPFHINKKEKRKKGTKTYCILILKFDNTSYFHISDVYSTELGVQNTIFNHKASRGLNSRLINLSINCLQQKGCLREQRCSYTQVSSWLSFTVCRLTRLISPFVSVNGNARAYRSSESGLVGYSTHWNDGSHSKSSFEYAGINQYFLFFPNTWNKKEWKLVNQLSRSALFLIHRFWFLFDL